MNSFTYLLFDYMPFISFALNLLRISLFFQRNISKGICFLLWQIAIKWNYVVLLKHLIRDSTSKMQFTRLLKSIYSLLHIFIPGFLLIKISYLELVEPFHYGINFVTHDDTVLHLKASVFGTSPSKLALYLIIYYIEMDLSTRKNGKIRPKMKRWNENFRFLLISIIA